MDSYVTMKFSEHARFVACLTLADTNSYTVHLNYEHVHNTDTCIFNDNERSPKLRSRQKPNMNLVKLGTFTSM